MPSFSDALCERTSDGLTVQALWDGFRARLAVSREGFSTEVDVAPSELLRAFYHPCCGLFLSDEQIVSLFPSRVWEDEETELQDFRENGGETGADHDGDTMFEEDGS